MIVVVPEVLNAAELKQVRDSLTEEDFLDGRATAGTRALGVKGTSPDVTVSGWANVSRNGHYNSVHNHVGYTWSGVYYVALGDSDPQAPSSGMIEFLDPRVGIDPEQFPGDAFWPYVRVTPRPA